MWENINGEYIWIDKEMGWEDNERRNSVDNDQVCACGDMRDHGHRLTTGGLAIGFAGGMIIAKAASRIGSWLLWTVFFIFIVMVVL